MEISILGEHLEISILGEYPTEEEAQEIYNALNAEGLEKEYSSILINTKIN